MSFPDERPSVGMTPGHAAPEDVFDFNPTEDPRSSTQDTLDLRPSDAAEKAPEPPAPPELVEGRAVRRAHRERALGRAPRSEPTAAGVTAVRTDEDSAQPQPTEEARQPRPPEGRLPLPWPPPRPRFPLTWRPHRPRLSRTGAALASVLVIGAALRLIGLDWDSGHHLHPDERFVTMVAGGVRFPSPDQYFDSTQSPLNPNRDASFVYGTLPLFVTRAVAEITQTAARAVGPADLTGEVGQRLRDLSGYGTIHLLGRGLSALADLLTVFLVFLIGRRLSGTAVGLVAALLSSLTVLQIQSAHFFTVEAPLTFFVTLAFYFSLRASQSGSLLDWAILGLATGLAAACKITALMLAVVVLAAAGLLWYRAARLGAYGERRRFLAEDLATGLLVAAALGFLAFRVAQPYAFAGPGIFDLAPNQRFLEVLSNFQRIGTGEADVPFNHSWAGATPFVWQLTQMGLWGMGLPLAVAGWIGAGFAAFQAIRDPRRYHLYLLALLWVLVNFAYWGREFTKLMRYLLPIYPQLTVFAALLVVSAWRYAVSPNPKPETRNSKLHLGALARASGIALAVAVVGWTAFYALSFVAIYTKPVSRITASHWIYENIPAGSRIGAEHWDDRLPLSLPGRDLGIYGTVDYPLYSEDTPEKRTQLIAKLDETDYLVLSSNRLYGSIPKLPLRYPLTTRYYEALFADELGFERIADFTSRPSLGGIELNDDNAEESFTVYDHPKVTIFQKGANYSTERVRSILDAVDLDNVLHGLKPIHARTSGLLLDSAGWAATRFGGSWTTMFSRGSVANTMPVVVWYLTLQLLALAALPLTWFLCQRLADGGYPLAKTMGLLAIAYGPWLLASVYVLPYTRVSILLAVIGLAVASGLVLARYGGRFFREMALRWRAILAMEALFAVAFVGFAALRAANPDLWHSAYGGEKPMDYAYLNAIIKTTWFPPYDPWFAGGYINYYYFGQVVVASLTKLTGIVPWVAYNLAIPTIAALTATSVASVVYNLLIARAAAPAPRQAWALAGGMAGAILAVVSGNLHGFVQLVDWLGKLSRDPVQSSIPLVAGTLGAVRGAWAGLTSAGQGLPPLDFNFWNPTRVITTEDPHPITEFPYFTFLYGDLHAHMIAMPFGLLVVALALNLIRQPPWTPSITGRPAREAALGLARACVSPGGLTLVLAGLVIGVVRMTNSWDYPTYLGLIAVAILLAEATAKRPWQEMLGRSVLLASIVLVASQVLIAPYLSQYQLFYTGLELTRTRTTAIHYLVIMGCFLGILGLYLAFRLSALRSRLAQGIVGALAMVSGPTGVQSATAAEVLTPASLGRRGWERDTLAASLAAGVVFVAVLVSLGGMPVVGIALTGMGILGVVAMLHRPAPATLFIFLLAATALAVTAGVEVLVLKGDIGRMNTVFKFYLQAWLFLAIASGVLLALLFRRARGSSWLMAGRRRMLGIGLGLAIGMTFIYPALATPAKLQHRFIHLAPSLDGMEYMAVARYGDERGDMVLPDDFTAINWMLDNIPGSPVIVEGLAPLYHWRSRVSIYTGLPTVIGWDWHQKQQRGDFAFMVDQRVRDVETIFSSPSPAAARSLLDKYQVEYVYIGGLEHAYYPRQGIEKFEAMVGSSLDPIYKNGAVTIYRVLR